MVQAEVLLAHVSHTDLTLEKELCSSMCTLLPVYIQKPLKEHEASEDESSVSVPPLHGWPGFGYRHFQNDQKTRGLGKVKQGTRPVQSGRLS